MSVPLLWSDNRLICLCRISLLENTKAVIINANQLEIIILECLVVYTHHSLAEALFQVRWPAEYEIYTAEISAGIQNRLDGVTSFYDLIDFDDVMRDQSDRKD